jgi:hypothetical protein
MDTIMDLALKSLDREASGPDRFRMAGEVHDLIGKLPGFLEGAEQEDKIKAVKDVHAEIDKLLSKEDSDAAEIGVIGEALEEVRDLLHRYMIPSNQPSKFFGESAQRKANDASEMLVKAEDLLQKIKRAV